MGEIRFQQPLAQPSKAGIPTPTTLDLGMSTWGSNTSAISSRRSRKVSPGIARVGVWVCVTLIYLASIAGSVWASLILVPILGILALPAFVACLLVLIYVIPTLAYLLMAQDDPPANVTVLLIPLNPVRNLGLAIIILQSLLYTVKLVSQVLWAIGRDVLWERVVHVSRRDRPHDSRGLADATRMRHVRGKGRDPEETEDKGKGKQKEGLGGEDTPPAPPANTTHGGIFEGFIEYNLSYRTRSDAKHGKLDIYLPQTSSGGASKAQPTSDVQESYTVTPGEDGVANAPSHAPDTDPPEGSAASTPKVKPTTSSAQLQTPGSSSARKASRVAGDRKRPSKAWDSSDTGTETETISHGRPSPTTADSITGLEADLIASTQSGASTSGHKVIVFVYDAGVISPLKPKKEWFVLLGTKLAKMGYLVVIPDITVYPDGGIEEQVTDLRYALSFVERKVGQYGGDPNSIYLMGHGLGAHLALYTIVQEAVVESIHCMEAEYERQRGLQVARSSRSRGRAIGESSPESSGEEIWMGGLRKLPPDMAIPNGLRDLRIYGGEVGLVKVKGIILLSPVTDIIRQIRHESTLFLEHLSCLRRSHGPTQVKCMRHSVGHLLFASKAILRPERVGRVMIVHGAQDTLIPLDSAHWLSELLYGLDIPTTFKPYRTLGHWEVLGCLMGLEAGSYTKWLERDLRRFVDD